LTKKRERIGAQGGIHFRHGRQGGPTRPQLMGVAE
jgi:hypothetical protein